MGFLDEGVDVIVFVMYVNIEICFVVGLVMRDIFVFLLMDRFIWGGEENMFLFVGWVCFVVEGGDESMGLFRLELVFELGILIILFLFCGLFWCGVVVGDLLCFGEVVCFVGDFLWGLVFFGEFVVFLCGFFCGDVRLVDVFFCIL